MVTYNTPCTHIVLRIDTQQLPFGDSGDAMQWLFRDLAERCCGTGFSITNWRTGVVTFIRAASYAEWESRKYSTVRRIPSSSATCGRQPKTFSAKPMSRQDRFKSPSRGG